jgi:hypothetical protein
MKTCKAEKSNNNRLHVSRIHSNTFEHSATVFTVAKWKVTKVWKNLENNRNREELYNPTLTNVTCICSASSKLKPNRITKCRNLAIFFFVDKILAISILHRTNPHCIAKWIFDLIGPRVRHVSCQKLRHCQNKKSKTVSFYAHINYSF